MVVGVVAVAMVEVEWRWAVCSDGTEDAISKRRGSSAVNNNTTTTTTTSRLKASKIGERCCYSI